MRQPRVLRLRFSSFVPHRVSGAGNAAISGAPPTGNGTVSGRAFTKRKFLSSNGQLPPACFLLQLNRTKSKVRVTVPHATLHSFGRLFSRTT